MERLHEQIAEVKCCVLTSEVEWEVCWATRRAMLVFVEERRSWKGRSPWEGCERYGCNEYVECNKEHMAAVGPVRICYLTLRWFE